MTEIPNGGEGLWRGGGWYEVVINMHMIVAGLELRYQHSHGQRRVDQKRARIRNSR
jgi:hypothetical protein